VEIIENTENEQKCRVPVFRNSHVALKICRQNFLKKLLIYEAIKIVSSASYLVLFFIGIKLKTNGSECEFEKNMC